MRVLEDHDGSSRVDQPGSKSSIDMASENSSILFQNETLSRYQRQTLANLINRFILQVKTGCGSPQCTTASCYTCKQRILPRQARRYNTVTARAMAVELATSADPNMYLCPYISREQVARMLVEAQEKTDPKSVIQQLFNTVAFRSFQATSLPSTDDRTLPDSSGVASSKIARTLRLTCDEMIAVKAQYANIRHHKRIESLSLLQTLPSPADEIMHTPGTQRLVATLSDFESLTQSFRDDSTHIWDKSRQHDLPSTRLDQAFRDWPSSMQIVIFDNVWLALGAMLKSPSTKSQLSQGLSNSPDSSILKKNSTFADIANIAIHALTASIPRAQRDNWHVVWSTIVNGRAYGKQRYRKSDPFSSPWLHILDAFESEPGLRLVQRLVQAIAARGCADVNSDLDSASDARQAEDPDIRATIIQLLIEEEKTVRTTKFGTHIRDEKLHGKPLLGTTTLLWLEWLRKCFLKSWDGTFRLRRCGVAGTALELMEDIWLHRGSRELDLPDDLFPTPVVFNNFNVDKVAIDWGSFQEDPDTRHIISFHFLYSVRGLTLFFRTVNHIYMRRAYCSAGAVQKLRSKAMPRSTMRDNSYLDQRMKIIQEPYLVLKINRHSVLADAYDQIWRRTWSELMKPLRVRMGIDEGEIGHDLGGVQIEFFKLACCEALDPDYALFSIDPQTHLSWFQPASLVPLYKFQLFGIIFALAVYNGVTLPVSFPLVFYRKLMGLRCDMNDLEEGWPDQTKAFSSLCEYDGSVEDDLARDYTFSFTANGLYLEVDMADPWREPCTQKNTSRDVEEGRLMIIQSYPDKHHPERNMSNGSQTVKVEAEGSDVEQAAEAPSHESHPFRWPGWEVEMAEYSGPVPAVTNANRGEYVKEYAQWLLDYSVRPQFQAFAKGFNTVIQPKALRLLTPETLRNLVEGHKHLDVNLLRRAATYRGYNAESQVIQWFWQTVHDYPEEKQKQLLEFVTASSRVPVNGAENLTFVIEKMVPDTQYLPGSSTCFSTLRLPEYESREVLQSKLDIALQHSLGFGQA